MPSDSAVRVRVLPWRRLAGVRRPDRSALGAAGRGLDGDVLEIGGGSGAMAAQLLATSPRMRMTVTDYDQAMVAAARTHLAPVPIGANVQQAEATHLPFVDDRFDPVLSIAIPAPTSAGHTAQPTGDPAAVHAHAFCPVVGGMRSQSARAAQLSAARAWASMTRSATLESATV